MPDVTELLVAAGRGDRQAAADLLPLVYDELRRLADGKMSHEKPGHTLQGTALVHEAYLRLVGVRSVSEGFNNRGHFFAAAAEAMRRILVENARRKKRLRHGGDHQRIELAEEPAVRDRDAELIELDDALSRLAGEDSPAAELAKLHVFVGMSVEEAGELLGLSRATAYRHWNYARAWLRCEMGG
jgi:RNA polymerase sigma factor (TIGR02999 family)